MVAKLLFLCNSNQLCDCAASQIADARKAPELGIGNLHERVVEHHRTPKLAGVVLQHHSLEERLGLVELKRAAGTRACDGQVTWTGRAVAHSEALQPLLQQCQTTSPSVLASMVPSEALETRMHPLHVRIRSTNRHSSSSYLGCKGCRINKMARGAKPFANSWT